MINTPITIDFSYLHSLTGGDKSFEQMLLAGTIVDVEIKINDLKESWEDCDPAGIRKNAHSLVSLSAIIGMPQVEGWTRTIDQTFVDGVFHPEMAVLANNIISGWPEAKSRIQEVIASY